MNGKNLLKKLGRTAAITTAALAVGAGSVLGYSVGCPEGPKVKISYESRRGPVSGTYNCTTAKGEDRPKEKRIVGDYDSFNLLEGNGAQFLAYTQNGGWNTADPNNLTHRGFFPFNNYTLGTFKVKSIPQEKPMVPTPAPVTVYSPRYTYITVQQPQAPEAPKEKSDFGIFTGLSKFKDMTKYTLGFVNGNFGAGIQFGSGEDKNLERTLTTSQTGRTLRGSVDEIDRESLGIFAEGHLPFEGGSVFAGAGIEKNKSNINTTEEIVGLAYDVDTRSGKPENGWFAHIGAEADLGENFRAGIVAQFNEHLNETGLGLRVTYAPKK